MKYPTLDVFGKYEELQKQICKNNDAAKQAIDKCVCSKIVPIDEKVERLSKIHSTGLVGSKLGEFWLDICKKDEVVFDATINKLCRGNCKEPEDRQSSAKAMGDTLGYEA